MWRALSYCTDFVHSISCTSSVLLSFSSVYCGFEIWQPDRCDHSANVVLFLPFWANKKDSQIFDFLTQIFTRFWLIFCISEIVLLYFASCVCTPSSLYRISFCWVSIPADSFAMLSTQSILTSLRSVSLWLVWKARSWSWLKVCNDQLHTYVLHKNHLPLVCRVRHICIVTLWKHRSFSTLTWIMKCF